MFAHGGELGSDGDEGLGQGMESAGLSLLPACIFFLECPLLSRSALLSPSLSAFSLRFLYTVLLSLSLLSTINLAAFVGSGGQFCVGLLFSAVLAASCSGGQILQLRKSLQLGGGNLFDWINFQG